MQQLWVEGLHGEGSTALKYYYNTKTGDWQYEKPVAFIAGAKTDAMIMKNMKLAMEGKQMENTQVQEKLAEARDARKKEEAEANWQWVEVYDPSTERFYYWNQETEEITWGKPPKYILACNDETMKAAILLQSAWKAKIARRAVEERRQMRDGSEDGKEGSDSDEGSRFEAQVYEKEYMRLQKRTQQREERQKKRRAANTRKLPRSSKKNISAKPNKSKRRGKQIDEEGFPLSMTRLQIPRAKGEKKRRHHSPVRRGQKKGGQKKTDKFSDGSSARIPGPATSAAVELLDNFKDDLVALEEIIDDHEQAATDDLAALEALVANVIIWDAKTDAEGYAYYHNEDTGETTHTCPLEVPVGWETYTDSAGHETFHNVDTGETKYFHPASRNAAQQKFAFR